MYKILSLKENVRTTEESGSLTRFKPSSRDESTVYALVESIAGSWCPPFITRTLDDRQMFLDIQQMYLAMNLPFNPGDKISEEHSLLISTLPENALYCIAFMIGNGSFDVTIRHPLVRAFLEAPSKMTPRAPSSRLESALSEAVTLGKIDPLQTDEFGIHFCFLSDLEISN